MKDTTFHFSATDRFTCNDCGHCCTSGLRVAIDSKTLLSLSTSLSYLDKKRQGYRPINFTDSKGPSLGVQSNGHCAFHSGGLCEIHSELGPEFKPVVCRTYPYNLVDTPHGTFVSLSYTCPAAVAGAGAPLNRALPELAKMVNAEKPEDRPFAERLSGHVQLTSSLNCEWEDYLKLESKLQEAFESSDPVGSLVRCATTLIERSLSPTEPSREWSFESPPENEEDAWGVFEVITKTNLNHFAKRISDPAQAKTEPCIQEIISTILEKRTIAKNKDIPCGAERPTDLMTTEVLSRYFSSLLYGKRMTSPTVATKLLSLAVALNMALLVQAEMTRLATTPHFNFEQLVAALNFVELGIMTHSTDLERIFSEFEKAIESFAKLS